MTTNGAGIQYYGGTEYYATTNIGTTPYPNNSNITITSPVYDLTSCVSGLTVSFPLQGRVENSYDFLRFQYRIGASAWITVQSFTGVQNVGLAYTTIPNTATQFRFLLQTDATVNTYGFPFVNVYYYDIAWFNISCINVLPVYLKYFYKKDGVVYWQFENNSDIDYYTIQRSDDGINFEDAFTSGMYYNSDDGLNYYRLRYQVKNQNYFSEIIAIDNRSSKKIVGIFSLDGKEVTIDCNCVRLVKYDDGTTKILY